MDEITEIQNWYLEQCNGDWEHQFGLQISTLDNPGWSIEIDLTDTDLETKPFESIEEGVGAESIEDDPNWYACKVRDNKFICHCGPLMLTNVLRMFLNWKNG